ncbi:hypothetical protein [Streptomyces sp. TRM68367]|uniref:hypothetical protein n=1 Tax=Streptomyces sp. TRM68367 TaxID=2758415 RepID=UPI00165B941A|nr:hypothetical protein [Streptomyces sp. TRM68367]MBC9730824.1 hypothetical protein [Streptomyces sp. TRM68367]
MDTTEIRDWVNLARCYIAALSDLVWSAAEIGDTTTLRYYYDKRHEAARDLKARVMIAVHGGQLTSEEGTLALSPTSSLEDAVVFTD